MPGTRQRSRRRARAHDASVPQPLIYALTVQRRVCALTAQTCGG
jgi:hypothetical protein